DGGGGCWERRSMHPAFASFVADAERLIADPQAIAARLGGLLERDGWLAPEHQLPGTDRYRQHLLHVSASRRLSVVALVWRPGQRTPIHDHVSWCVVGVYRGVEQETRYRLVDRGGIEQLQYVETIEAHPGHVEALIPPAENIHVVEAGGPGLALSVPLHGAAIQRLGAGGERGFCETPAAARTVIRFL